MITTDRTRTEAGEIRFITSDEASEIKPGTIIRPFGGERFDVESVEVKSYGETIFTNWHGEKLRMSNTNRVEILGYFNPSGVGIIA